MNKFILAILKLVKGLLYFAFSFLFLSVFLKISPSVRNFSLLNYLDSIKHGIEFGYIVFFLMGAIALFIRGIYKLWNAFYILFFYKNPMEDAKMEVQIDEKDIIKDSFIEFGNGDKIPIIISRIQTNRGSIDEREKKDN